MLLSKRWCLYSYLSRHSERAPLPDHGARRGIIFPDLQDSIFMQLRIATIIGSKNITVSMLPCGTHSFWSCRFLRKRSCGHSLNDNDDTRIDETFRPSWMVSLRISVKCWRNSRKMLIRKPRKGFVDSNDRKRKKGKGEVTEEGSKVQ